MSQPALASHPDHTGDVAPIRVGFVVHVMQVAGAEVLIRETIRRLGPAIVPTVFCLDKVGQIGEELVAQGVDLVCLNRRPGWDFSVSRKLAAAANGRRIEVFHAHQYTPFFYTALAKYLVRPAPKVILTEHGRHYPDLVSPPRRAVNRIVLDRLADAVNACCAFSGRALCRVDGFAGSRIEVIENGIEVDRYGPADDRAALRRKLGLAPERRVIVHVARHHPVKDQATLIRGFALAAPALPDVDLVMVGDGPLREQLTGLADSLGVKARIRFVGIQANVPDWLRAADVFALTSVSEAASLTLLEAMATGLPVVVTDVGGNPEIVRHEREGLLFPRGDAGGCAAAFRRLFEEPGLASSLGQAARERAHAKYRLEQTIGAYYRLYQRLAGR
ncbi:glycosyltransferase [Fimbriiglobus ruber]|uniref:Putative glycosyl transferase n=1 Tax=Fimbriiglobus ruber TaxID=1908690 RepID=A0A225DV68_9BACT|nr:glycosyltransferase [Fimbriiglobus ruber]OWK43554.1 putative glycosyl transferase [Fimbriiglobus ruber]